MSEIYHEFDESSVNSALAAIAEPEEAVRSQKALTANDDIAVEFTAANTTFSLLANCITVKASGGRVCLKLPLGLGKHCIKLPGNLPVDVEARACISIKYKKLPFGVKIPCGVEVTISVNGQVVARQSFGAC